MDNDTDDTSETDAEISAPRGCDACIDGGRARRRTQYSRLRPLLAHQPRTPRRPGGRRPRLRGTGRARGHTRAALADRRSERQLVAGHHRRRSRAGSSFCGRTELSGGGRRAIQRFGQDRADLPGLRWLLRRQGHRRRSHVQRRRRPSGERLRSRASPTIRPKPTTAPRTPRSLSPRRTPSGATAATSSRRPPSSARTAG